MISNKPRNLQRASSSRAKPGMAGRSWHWARFLPARLTQCIVHIPRSASRQEIVPSTQVQAPAVYEGFTVVELLVGISVGSILFIAFMVAISNQFALIIKNNANIEMSNTAQNLLRTTVENLRNGDGVRQTNSISDANAPVGGWNTSNNNFVVVIDTPALDSSHNYIIDPNSGDPYMNELVYYKSGISLLVRQLANPSANGNSVKTSCPAAQASPGCLADADLGDYFQSMSFNLYDQDNVATNDPAAARLIKINLTMQRTVFGEVINLNNTIAVTLRNRF